MDNLLKLKIHKQLVQLQESLNELKSRDEDYIWWFQSESGSTPKDPLVLVIQRMPETVRLKAERETECP